jgi:hypothetical protein
MARERQGKWHRLHEVVEEVEVWSHDRQSPAEEAAICEHSRRACYARSKVDGYKDDVLHGVPAGQQYCHPQPTIVRVRADQKGE